MYGDECAVTGDTSTGCIVCSAEEEGNRVVYVGGEGRGGGGAGRLSGAGGRLGGVCTAALLGVVRRAGGKDPSSLID